MAVAAEKRTTAWTPPAAPVEKRAGGPPLALAAALGVAVLYAASASGAIGLPEETRLQVGVALLSLLTLAGLLFGRQLRFTPDGRGRLGLWLLAGFAAWSALSLAWSIAPDETWFEANRAVAYALVVFLGLVVGSSLPRAAERVALGYLAIATGVALYAVAGKVLPGVFDHANDLSRLRAPLDYWNALALFCVLAVPPAVQLAADRRFRMAARMAGLLALLPLLLTIALTYSRGGILVLVVALGVQLAFTRERLNLMAFAATGLVAVVPALVVAVMRDDLTTDRLAGSARADDGVLLGVALLFGVVAALLAGRGLARRSEPPRLSRAGVLAARRAAALAGAIAFVALAVLTASGWTGDQFESFAEVRSERTTDPNRLLNTNSGNRWVWWEEAAGAAWDEPLTGHGAGSFPLVHLLYREEALPVRQPHSVPLEFLAETGLVGGLLGLGGLGFLLVAGLSRTRWRVGGERGFAAALAGGSVAFGVHLFIDWDWDIPGVMVPLLVFLGVLASLPAEDQPPRRPAYGLRGVGLAVAGVLLALVSVSAVLPALAQEKTSEALGLTSDSPEDLREAAEKAALARKLDPFGVDALFASAGIADRRGQQRLAVRFLIDAVERQPDNPRGWVRLARRQALLGDVPAASESTAILRSLDWLNDLSFVLLSAASYDERASATVTGTPLPLFVEPRFPALPFPAPGTVPAPVTPAPVAPAPAPVPTPTPPTPTPPEPQGEPFRLDG